MRLGMVFQAASSIIAGLIIGFIYSWQLSLLICAVAPLMAVAGFIEMRIVMGASHKDKEALQAAGKVHSSFVEIEFKLANELTS